MELRESEKCIRLLATSAIDFTNKLRWFLFGSALNLDQFPNDLDVLVIYKDQDDPHVVRHILDRDFPLFYPPLHLVFLTEDEEQHYNLTVHGIPLLNQSRYGLPAGHRLNHLGEEDE